MAVNVSYKNRIGWYIKTEKWTDEPEQKFKNWICHANCLWADMHFSRVSETFVRYGKTYKKGSPTAALIAFWTDGKHLKSALANGAYKNVSEFHFYADQMTTHIWSAVKILANAGKKVIVEPIKKK